MAWLHENKEEFRNAVLFAAEQNRLAPAAVEKDYYVTLILKGLKERLPFIVFKGGTSLSKCHKVWTYVPYMGYDMNCGDV